MVLLYCGCTNNAIIIQMAVNNSCKCSTYTVCQNDNKIQLQNNYCLHIRSCIVQHNQYLSVQIKFFFVCFMYVWRIKLIFF